MAPMITKSFFDVLANAPETQLGIVVVLALMALDVIFGLINAVAHHNFDSSKMREGIMHKAGSMGFMLVGWVMDASLLGGFDIGFSAPVLSSVLIYLAIMEVGSLLEHIADLNPELGKSPLFRALKRVEQTLEGEADTEVENG